MRVGIDIRCLAEGRSSGVGEYLCTVLKDLLDKDKKNQYILFYNSFHGERASLDWLSLYPNVEIKDYRFPNKLLNLSLWLLNWPKIDRLIGGVSLFFSPNIGFTALSSDCKKILTIHDLSFERFNETFSFKRKLWHFMVNPRGLCRQADIILAVSRSTKQDLISLYKIIDEKIIISYPPIDYQEYIEARLDSEKEFMIRRKYKIKGEFILFLGTLEPRKNINGLIDAYNALCDEMEGQSIPNLVIAGPPGWKYEEIYKRQQESPYRQFIHFTSFIEEKDKPYIYKLARVVVYPSFFEGFGFPPLEAMAAGAPVICSNCSSLPEVVEDAALLIDPYRPNEIKEAIKMLLLDKNLAQDYRQRGYERIEALKGARRVRLKELANI